MSTEWPPRLEQDPELGRILRAADASISPERIASNGAAVKTAIAAAVVKTLPLWFKLGLPLVLLVAGYALYRGLARDDAPAPATPVVTTVMIDAAPMIELDAAPMIELDAAPLIELDAAIPVVDAGASIAVKKPKPPVVVAEPPPADAAAPPPVSDLPAQIALYESAREAAANGNVSRGIELLDELFARFPSTQLRAEAELTRAELLARANRLTDAVAALDALIASPAHRGRRGELWRALGDVRRKQGDCRRAVEAYTHARAHALPAREIAKVERGLESCAAPK